MSTRYTTTRLTLPPERLPLARAIAGGVVVVLVLSAFILDALERRQAVQDVQPQIIILIATPTPQPPTLAPTLAPTPQPVIIVQTVEVPVYIEVQPAPVVYEAPATFPPPTQAPVVIGEVVSWDGVVQQVAP